MSDAARIRELHARLARVRAELAAVENGTLPLLERDGPLTPAEVARRLGCTIQNANHSLTKLVRVGLAEREARTIPNGGREFWYSAAPPQEHGDG